MREAILLVISILVFGCTRYVVVRPSQLWWLNDHEWIIHHEPDETAEPGDPAEESARPAGAGPRGVKARATATACYLDDRRLTQPVPRSLRQGVGLKGEFRKRVASWR
jgi:hypothetical protein